MMKNRKYLHIIPLIALLSACSVKKDTAMSRFYHSTTGWYNTIFNANEALKEEIKNISTKNVDDYSQILDVAPGQTVPMQDEKDYTYEYKTIEHKKSNQLGALLDKATGLKTESQQSTEATNTTAVKSEEKAIKAIEGHSMVIKGTERNPMMAEAYLILGKSRYYQGKPYEAMDALNYINSSIKIKKKKKRSQYINEAKLWLAKANFQAENNDYALQELVALYQTQKLNKTVKLETASLYSQILIDEKKYSIAYDALEKTKKLTKDKSQKGRITFVQAQLQTKLGNYLESSKLYDKVHKYHPGFDMEFWAKMGIAQNYAPGKNSYEAFQKELKKMQDDSNYKEYKSQLFYNQGLIAAKEKKYDEAETYFKKGLLIKEGTDSLTKAFSYSHLADYYFSKEEYLKSANYYDSAATEIKGNAAINKKYKELKILVDNDEIMKNNDSILAVVALSPEAQRTYYQQKIDKKKAADQTREKAIQKAIDEKSNVSRNTNTIARGTSSYDDKGKFYFYNQTLKEKGAQEFKQNWGERALTDNWRIATRTSQRPQTTTSNKENIDNARKYEPDYYIEQLPKDAETLQKLKQVRDSAEFNIGTQYLEAFKNNKKAISTFEDLLTQKPNEELKGKTYFSLLLAAEPNSALYNKYKNLIISEFPNTYYADYATNPASENFTTKNSNTALALYEKAFNAYEKKNTVAYEQYAKEAVEKYGKEEIMAKFALLNAFQAGRTKGKEEMLAALQNVILVYPKLAESKKAKELIELIHKEYPEIGKKPSVSEVTQQPNTVVKPMEESPQKPVEKTPNEPVEMPQFNPENTDPNLGPVALPEDQIPEDLPFKH